MILDYERLTSLMSDKGGYVKALTDRLGVNWPLEEGWKRLLSREGRDISEEEWDALQSLRNLTSKRNKKLTDNTLSLFE